MTQELEQLEGDINSLALKAGQRRDEVMPGYKTPSYVKAELNKLENVLKAARAHLHYKREIEPLLRELVEARDRCKEEHITDSVWEPAVNTGDTAYHISTGGSIALGPLVKEVWEAAVPETTEDLLITAANIATKLKSAVDQQSILKELEDVGD